MENGQVVVTKGKEGPGTSIGVIDDYIELPVRVPGTGRRRALSTLSLPAGP